MKINISIDIDNNEIINIIKRSIGNNNKNSSADTINISGIVNNIKKKENNIQTKSNPNRRYDPDHTIVATLNSIEEVSLFLSDYNHDNNYCNSGNELKLGQRIQINDGTYNATWYIAGFDCEYNKIASDGTTYDNGYGIALIPETYLMNSQWNTINIISGGYLNSYINKTTLPTISNNLKKVLGTHLIERNVLLSSSISGDNSNNYTWTTAYATLPSVGQLTGTFASHNNKYDDGEANYKLPLFNFMEYKTGSYFWSRGIYSSDRAWHVDVGGGIYDINAISSYGVRPLIYIR